MHSREDAGSHYDKISRWYDLITGPAEKRYRNAGLELLAAQEGDSVLEIGCGTGQAATVIAESVGTHGALTVLDISSRMLKITKNRLAKKNYSQQCNIIRGDAYDLPFTDDQFTAIYMSFTLELFSADDIHVVLGQCRRVLKQGGRMVVVSMSRGKKRGNILRLYEWLHRSFPKMIDCRPIPAGEYISKSGFIIKTIREMSLASIPVEVIHAEKA